MSAEAQVCACGCGQPVWRWRLAEPCARLLAGMCVGKTRFSRHASAVAHRKAGQQTYVCEVCGTFHNGGAGGAAPEILSARRGVVWRLRERGKGWLLTYLAGEIEGRDRMDWKTGRI